MNFTHGCAFLREREREKERERERERETWLSLLHKKSPCYYHYNIMQSISMLHEPNTYTPALKNMTGIPPPHTFHAVVVVRYYSTHKKGKTHDSSYVLKKSSVITN